MKDKYPAMAKMLSLKPFAKPSGGLRSAVAFGAFFFMTTMMFPVFLATFPLRWMVCNESAHVNHNLNWDKPANGPYGLLPLSAISKALIGFLSPLHSSKSAPFL